MCHLIVIQINKKSPLTKTGSEIPKSTNIELRVSGHRFLNLAAKTPSPTPTTNQSTSAPMARLKVIGSACPNISVTHRFSLNEYPNAGAGQWNAAPPVP